MIGIKCGLDSNALDWIVDDPRGIELMDQIESGAILAIVAADNAHEVHRIPDSKAEKRERLQALLKSSFRPLAPTHIPISGIARAGLARIATPEVMELRRQLETIGVAGLDANHLINTSREGCEVFVTLDGGILRKRDQILRLLRVKCVQPNDPLAMLQAETSARAG